MTPFRKPVGITDAVLLLLGLAGFVLFFRVLPAEHPDAAADYSLGSAGAAEAARTFLRDSGYETATLDPQAEFRRQSALLDSLQEAHGRSQAVALLQADTAGILPAYYWRVEWVRGAVGDDDSDASVFTVSLDSKGRVWDFRKQASARPAVLRRVLAVLSPAPDSGGTPRLPEAVSDSLLRASLIFTDNETAWDTASVQREANPRADSIWQVLEAARITKSLVEVGPEWAIALARHHLSESALGSYNLDVDSVWTGPRSDRKTAYARFVGTEPVYGQAVETMLEVHVTGALLEMETDFLAPSDQARMRPPAVESDPSPPEERNGLTVEGDITLGGILDFVQGITYFALVVAFLFVFFRRLHARTIDIRTALRDALWGGLFLATFIGLSAGYQIFKEVPNPWLGLFLTAIATLMSGAAGAVVIFVVSNAADSLARGVWPEKLESLTLMRLGLLRNVPVGLAFLRGAALGGVLLGLLVLTLIALPGARLDFTEEGGLFLHQEVLSPVGFVFSQYGFASLFLVLIVLLGTGSMIYQRSPRPLVVLPSLILLFLLVQIGPATLEPASATLIQAGAIGAVLALVFWRYDALTCFFGYLVVGLLWDLAPAWIMEPTPLAIDGVAALVLLGVAVLIGLVGVVSGRTEAELPSYVPSYVQELAQEERLKGELEIAHMVQESFLPKKMPRVAGVDVAAMCLAAQEVGGDYYDFVELGDGRLAMVIGDVSGKGIQAAFYMTLVKGFFITLCRTVDSPAEILRRINALFCENAPRGMFISLICGILDVEARTFTFARAGHNPLILKRSPSYEPEFVQPAGMAIGLISGPRFDESMQEVTIPLRSGDVLVLYTDGFTEAMNARRQQYGDTRLAYKVSGAGQRSAVEILRAVSEDVHHFLEAVGRQDDMTMVVVKMEHRPTHFVSTSVRKEMAPQAELPQAEAGV